jgi:uncharacterized protein
MKKLFLFLFLISIGFAQQPQLPELKSYANDFTGTLDQEQLSALNYRLQTFDDSTSNQLVLLIVPTINDYPLEEYANETAVKNKIGSKKNDNGILFLIVKDDKKIRIEVGYGLEGALPDALANSIIRNVVVPDFKRNDYYSGISNGINAIILATKGEYKAENKRHSRNSFSGIIIIFFVLSSIFRGGRRRGGGFFFPGGFGGGGFSSGGGGFGGGGFSGGGGGFGGGGSSGGW